ncbi:MAG: hypothetical protein ACXWXS_02595 [Actinomycetota bacterium]
MSERVERVAKNEATAREINEGIEQAHTGSPGDYFRIVCECGNFACERVIAISIPEYEAVRSDPLLFAVVAAHVMPGVEDVVRAMDRFSIVRKHEGVPAEIAEQEDPRS